MSAPACRRLLPAAASRRSVPLCARHVPAPACPSPGATSPACRPARPLARRLEAQAAALEGASGWGKRKGQGMAELNKRNAHMNFKASARFFLPPPLPLLPPAALASDALPAGGSRRLLLLALPSPADRLPCAPPALRCTR